MTGSPAAISTAIGTPPSAMEETELVAERRLQNARIGYQVAAQLWAYEGQGVWSAFNAMLVANAIVIAAEGTSGGAFTKHPALTWILPLFGLLLSLLWYALVDRGFTIHKYRVLATRDLERFLESVETVSRGASVNAGHEVSFTFPDDLSEHVQLSCVGKLFSGRRLALFVTLLFAGFHFVVLVLAAVAYLFGERTLGFWD